MNSKVSRNPQLYAKELVKAHGLAQAYEIAKNCQEVTSPSSLTDLPVGPIFFNKSEAGKYTLKNRELLKTTRFWENVFGILKNTLHGTKTKGTN